MRSWNLIGVVLLLAAVLACATPAGAQSGFYVVQPGDSLNSVAAAHGVSTVALMRANNLLDADFIWIGQRLVIPGSPVSGVGATAQATTPSRTPLPPTTAASSYYTVAAGDTIVSIAAALGVNADQLVLQNNLTNPDLLVMGQQLRIPVSGTPQQVLTAVTTLLPTVGTPTARLTVPLQLVGTGTPGTPAALGTGSVTPAGTTTITPPPPPTPSSGQGVYTIKPGETLRQVAERYNVSALAIARANRISNPDSVSAGTVLKIPGNDPSWTMYNWNGRATRFVASISQQRCWLYEDLTLVADWTCSTGQEGNETRPGTYTILSKMDKAYGSVWNIWMPYWLGIYYAGRSENGIHGIPYNASDGWKMWEGFVGTPITFGCVLLDNVNAKTLFEAAWVGMPVTIDP
jgi:LysM repeat protein